LTVVTGALVHRIRLDGTRAVGVEYARDGRVERVDAAREVILAAGAVGSPHLLQLSGVGDPAHLGRVGIPVRHVLRGVGKNLQDHYLARVTCVVTGAKTLNEKSRGLPFAGEVLRYLFAGTGMLTYAASLVAASVKVLEESATPDIQCLLAAGSFAPGAIRRLEDKAGRSVLLSPRPPLQDGSRRDGGRRSPAAGSRPPRAARHRRVGDADRHFDQHQRADNHDRRKGRRDDPGGDAAEAGGLAQLPNR